MQPQLLINTQYIKDFSLEIPHAPEIFKEIKGQPKISLDFAIKHKNLEDKFYEVVLSTSINGDIEDKKLFVVELEYACVARIEIKDELIDEALNIAIPQQLFPFVRSIIANIMTDAGLPPLMLTPIDFATVYKQKNKDN